MNTSEIYKGAVAFMMVPVSIRGRCVSSMNILNLTAGVVGTVVVYRTEKIFPSLPAIVGFLGGTLSGGEEGQAEHTV
jgi:hypothetical protein